MYITTYITTILFSGLAVLVALIHKVITKEIVVLGICGWVVGAIVVAILFKHLFKIYADVRISEARNAKYSSDELLAYSFSGIQGLTYFWICFITGMLVAVISMLVNALIQRLAIHYENFLKIAPKIKQ